MCFKDNISLFKAINWFFTLVHMALLLACILTISHRKENVTTNVNTNVNTNVTTNVTYYQLDLDHMHVYAIYNSVFTHSMGLLFHFIFAIYGAAIVDHYFSYNYTNPLRWFIHLIVDGSAMIGLMLINGFRSVDTIVLIIVIYASTLGYCYLQDQYLNTFTKFEPDREPQNFAIPLYFVLVFFISIKSPEHKVSIITSVLLLIHTLFKFILQWMHIRYQYRVDPHELNDDENEEGVSTLENVVNIKQNKRNDAILDEIRRGIKYEGFYYINSVLFEMTITWIIISNSP